VLRWLCSKAQVFVTMHNSLPPVPGWRYFQWRIKFWLLTRSKNFHIFTANKDTKESLRRLVPPASFDKIKVIYANINPEEVEEALADKLNRAEICQKYNLPNDKFMVFCVGQFIDRKGRWIFLEAAKKLLEKNQDTAFVWISNSKPCAEDLKKAESYGLGENFTLITADQVGSEHIDLFKLMRLADVFALPSYLEGLPISIIEAMALGIPTISTNINAIPEAIKHLETGLLIEPGKSEALTNAVETLKSDPNLRKKLAENGRKYVFEKFNQKVVAKIAVENYIAAFRRQK
jgi:glycosyltransferase involved in cell wall biosynthesis